MRVHLNIDPFRREIGKWELPIHEVWADSITKVTIGGDFRIFPGPGVEIVHAAHQQRILGRNDRAGKRAVEACRGEKATDIASDNGAGGEGCVVVNTPVDGIATVKRWKTKEGVDLVVIPRMTKGDGGGMRKSRKVGRGVGR